MYAPWFNSCVASNMRMLACGGPRNCNSKVTEAMKRLNCYRPYKEYANKLQDWRQAARSHDWVRTSFKGLEDLYGATFSELFRYVDTAQKHRELSRETREQLQQRIERVFLESIPQLPLALGAAADVRVPSLFDILVRRVGDKVECVWPGDSGYHFQITSVHDLAIGFPGRRKVALASQLMTK